MNVGLHPREKLHPKKIDSLRSLRQPQRSQREEVFLPLRTPRGAQRPLSKMQRFIRMVLKLTFFRKRKLWKLM